MSKDELLSLLNGARATFLYAYFVESLAWKKCPDLIDEARRGGGFRFEGRDGESVQLSLITLADQLQENTRELRGNFFLFQDYEAIRLFYELTLEYCQRTKQTATYAAEAWLQFARVMRNVVSHGSSAYLTQWPSNLEKKGITSVTWRHLTVAKSQVGKDVHLGIVDILKLQEDIYAFCRDKLK